mgnify:CR=1 FL=1|jgi:hypothetical protein
MSKLGDYIKQQKEKDIERFFGKVNHTSNKYKSAAEYLMIPVCIFKDWEKGIGIDDSSTKVAIRTLAKYHRYNK